MFIFRARGIEKNDKDLLLVFSINFANFRIFAKLKI